jgi:periplasmic copper chaperone A
MRSLMILPLALVLLAAGCDGAKKAEAPTQDMAAMEMPLTPAPLPAGPAAMIGDITVSDGWAPVTPVGARVAAGYFTIKNSGAVDDKLLSAASGRAKTVELHEMAHDANMMTMRRVPALTLKAGETVTLAPGGYHLMLLEPALPYIDAETIPVTLNFERAGKLEIQLIVRPRESGGGEHAGH